MMYVEQTNRYSVNGRVRLPPLPWLVDPLDFPPAFKKNEGVKITSEKGAKGQMNVKNQEELSQKLAQDEHSDEGHLDVIVV